MRPNKVKEMWKRGEPVTAGWLSTGNAFLAEVMAHAGFDAIILDMQHGMVFPEQALSCLQAISTTDTVPLCRMSWNDPKDIQFVLDAGAYGVIVPLVNTRAEAEKAVGAVRYPPLGYRSTGAYRARYYAGTDYARRANDEIICLAMIETLQAIDNLEEISNVTGLDGFYIGPADLALSMGLAYVPTTPKTPPPRRRLSAGPRHGARTQLGALPPRLRARGSRGAVRSGVQDVPGR